MDLADERQEEINILEKQNDEFKKQVQHLENTIYKANMETLNLKERIATDFNTIKKIQGKIDKIKSLKINNIPTNTRKGLEKREIAIQMLGDILDD